MRARVNDFLKPPPTPRLFEFYVRVRRQQTIALVFLHILNVDMAFTLNCKLILLQVFFFPGHYSFLELPCGTRDTSSNIGLNELIAIILYM